MEINFNQIVKVQFTEKGKGILKEYYENMKRRIFII